MRRNNIGSARSGVGRGTRSSTGYLKALVRVAAEIPLQELPAGSALLWTVSLSDWLVSALHCVVPL